MGSMTSVTLTSFLALLITTHLGVTVVTPAPQKAKWEG